MENTKGFDRFGVMVDCSRNGVMKPAALRQWIDILSRLGYTTLMLYTEDTYEVENQPYFGYLRGRYSAAEIRELDAYAASKGIELVPCIQTLAHLHTIFRWEAYGDIRDCEDILLADEEKTYALLEDMFSSLEKNFTSRLVNVGMDEAPMLGRGRYKDIHGWQDSVDLLLRHLRRVAAIADRHGFRLLMWGDMFFRLLSDGQYYTHPEVSDAIRQQIPANVHLVYWDYYSRDTAHYDAQIKAHAGIKDDIWFAGGLWSWTGFAPHNGFSIEATKAALTACRANGVDRVILTMWGDNGGECSRFALLPALYYAAMLNRGITDRAAIEQGFAETFGMAFSDFCLLDLPGTPNGDPTATNDPDKYMLYNDLFLGQFDASVPMEDGRAYEACADRLAAVKAPAAYSHLFRTQEALCRVLAAKWDMGCRIRAAYRQQDKAAVRELCGECRALREKVQAFYEAFKVQWMAENKPYGFEVQDIRLGGLMQRLDSCRERLEAWADDRLPVIEELEEDILPLSPGQEPACRNFNSWALSVTANVL